MVDVNSKNIFEKINNKYIYDQVKTCDTVDKLISQ